MKHTHSLIVVALALSVLFLPETIAVPSEFDDDFYSLGDYTNDVNQYLSYAKRSCVARGGSCDHRQYECCPSSTCKCNLWGVNCRCQRKGLFTKLG